MQTSTTSRTTQFDALIVPLSLTATLVFWSAASGVDDDALLRIIFGVYLQTALGLCLLDSTSPKIFITQDARIAAGFVFGVIPIALAPRAGGWIFLLGVLLAGWVIRRLSPATKHSRRVAELPDHSETVALRYAALVCLVTSLVFVRFNRDWSTILICLASLTLLGVPQRRQKQTTYLYSMLCAGLGVQRALFNSESDVFQYFRSNHDWVEEQIIATSFSFGRIGFSPFVLGDNLGYHYFSQLYWGSFERLFQISPFSFSGPGLLALQTISVGLLFLRSPLLSRYKTLKHQWGILLLLLFGSWPFWDSFVFDQLSRSQNLSLMILMLVLGLLTARSKMVTLILVPLLTTVLYWTKVSTALFVVLLIFTIAALTLIHDLQIHRKLTSTALFVLGQLAISGIGVCTIHFLVFLQGARSTFSSVEFGWKWPDTYEWIGWGLTGPQRVLAFAPVTFGVIMVSFELLRKREIQCKRQQLQVALPIASFCSLPIGLTVFSSSGISVSTYIPAVCALAVSLAIGSRLEIPHISPSLTVIGLLTILGFSVVYFSLQAVSWSSQGANTRAVPLIFGLCIGGFGLFQVIRRLPSSLWHRLGYCLILVSFSYSLGVVLAGDQGKVSADFFARQAQFEGTLKVRESLSEVNNMILAVEPLDDAQLVTDRSFTEIPNLIAALTPVQFWALPRLVRGYYPADNAAFKRVTEQSALARNPNKELLEKVRQQGATHLLLLSKDSQNAWAWFIEDLTSDASFGRPLPRMLFPIDTAWLVEL